MQTSIVIERLVQVAIIILGLIIAVFFANLIAVEDYRTLGACFAILGVIALYFAAGSYFWAFAFGAMFLNIKLPFIPLSMTPYEVMLILSLGYYFINELALKKNIPKTGAAPEGFFLIAAFIVVFYHGVTQRFGVRLLGSDLWGGRAYLSIIFAVGAYFCLQSLILPVRVWNRLPWFILAFGFLDFCINLWQKLAPESLRVIDPFFVEDPFSQSRWGFMGNFGYILIITAFAYLPLTRWFSARNLCPLVGGVLGFIFCALSGYRSSSTNAILYYLVGGWRDLRAGVVLMPIILGIGLISLSIYNSAIQPLPPAIQRGLVWFPGDWDPDMRRDAEGSNKFRVETWQYFLNHQFPQQMWFGRGLAVPFMEIIQSMGEIVVDPLTGASQFKHRDRDYSFYVNGNLHNGFLSTLDRFGIIGGAFIFLFTIVAFRKFISYLGKNKPQRSNFCLQWISLYGTVHIIGFPMGALRIDDFFPVIVFLLGVFNSLNSSCHTEQMSTGYSRANINNSG